MCAECFSVTLLKFSLTLRPSVLHVLQLLCLDPECHRDKNEAQVILVSFFSAMVTVMEGVSALPCERSAENKAGILQHDFLINIVPLPLIKP